MSTQETGLAVRKSAVVGAPIERAFKVFTDEIASWWPLQSHSVGGGSGKPVETAVLEGRVGGRFYERMADGTEASWGEVTAWEPPHRLAIAWRVNPEWPAATEIEVRFTPDGDGTRVDFEHRGWEKIGDLAEEAHGNYSEGWTTVFGCYVDAVDGQ
jgi:uncharacterized protein YndB with AHSA1/START domain